MTHPILVTGAAGRVGGVGGLVVEALQRRGLPVRAMVRREDERAEALSTASAYRFVRRRSKSLICSRRAYGFLGLEVPKSAGTRRSL